MADPMWTGGPDQFQDRYSADWATFPQWMRDPLLPQTPPMTPFAMSVTCLVLMAVPVIGTTAAINLGEYQRYYGDAYEASPPGSHTDTPYDVAPPTVYTPAFGADPTTAAMLTLIYGIASDAYGKANQAYEATQLILDRLPQGENPPPITTSADTARILAAIYYIAQLPFTAAVKIDDQAILDRINTAQSAIIGDVDLQAATTVGNIDGYIDLRVGNLSDWLQTVLPVDLSGVSTAVSDQTTTLTGEIAEGTAAVLAALNELPTNTAGDPRFPGLAGVTLSNPVPISGPTQITGAMDGCLVTINSVPPGTGTHTAGDYRSFLHGGWLAFIGPDGYGDELQYLNLESAAYCPKRVAPASAVIILPRAGMSVTLTPYTLA